MNESVEQAYQFELQSVQKRIPLLESPTANRGMVYYSMFTSSRSAGVLALLLRDQDATALRHFQEAVTYARHMLWAPAATLRTTEIDLTLRPRGGHTIVERDVTPPPASLSIPTFHEALTVVIAFGDASTCQAFAAYPEDRFQSSAGLVLSPTYLPNMRALKACLAGNQTLARREAQAVRDAAPNPGLKAEMQALLAAIDRDAPTFQANLDIQLAVHKKRFDTKENRHDFDGTVCWPALMLCRLAKVQGIAVADDGYLPAHLVPADPVR